MANISSVKCNEMPPSGGVPSVAPCCPGLPTQMGQPSGVHPRHCWVAYPVQY